MRVVCVVVLCGLLGAVAATGFQCGTSVDYFLHSSSLQCLHHNATSFSPATGVMYFHGKVSSLWLLPGHPVELPPQTRGSSLSLRSSYTVCYLLSHGGCRGGERQARDVHLDEPTSQVEHSVHELLVLPLTVAALLVVIPLSMASFLCCPGGKGTSQTLKSRRFSKKDRKSMMTSTDISINITDSDHPLGSDNYTTFHKDNHLAAALSPPAVLGSAHSAPSLLDHSSADHLLESSLDIGTRPASRHEQRPETSPLSSVLSLGPRIPPEGSSLENLLTIEKITSHISLSSHHPPSDMPPPPTIPPPPSHQPPDMPPPPTIPPPPSHQPPNMPPPPTVPPPPSHLRQHSTPISCPPPLSPPHKPRPQTIIGQPHSPRAVGPPVLPPKSHPPSSPSPVSPVSLSESEALGSVKPGRVRPYRVVHQPSLSLSSIPHLPHSSDGSVCTQCGARLTTGSEPQVQSNCEEFTEELCQECQASDHDYQELKLVDEDTSPPPSPHHTASPEQDPLYERIGSVRRKHVVSSFSRQSVTAVSSNEGPDVTMFHPHPSPRSNVCSLPPGETSHFPKGLLPSEGASLPPHPPTLHLRRERSSSNHDYESLQSTFGQHDSPGETMYASIPSPTDEEVDTPPYVPENSQRAQMLKIDSEGYAEVLNKEEEEEEPRTPNPDQGYSPVHHLTASQASDYEVPVRISQPLMSSPSHSHLSPSHPLPIPVPTPMAPSLHPAPPSLPLPSERHHSTPASTTPLKRQAAVTENPLPLPSRSLHVLPGTDRESQEEDRRDSSGSVASCYLSYRLSNASSGLGESMTESLRGIAEETDQEGGGEKKGEGRTTKVRDNSVIIKEKIYEVENRSRTKSYPVIRPTDTADVTTRKQNKARTMRARIRFNEDSQAV